uniref:Leucine--tRNA ligase n=1 Tax=Zeugodacus cucurbitae TaxID=28588 RepID=A0A0A1XGD8_ZEUCU
MCNNELRIDGLPKNLSILKLSKLLNRYNKSWELEDLIPLEEYIIANICCKTKESYDCFLKLPDLVPFSTFPNIRVYNASLIPNYVEQNNPDYAPNDSIFKLNSDCLQYVFEKCSLGDQITFAKVCRKFHKVIIDIFSKKFDAILLSHPTFTTDLALTDQDIWDFSILCGPYVRTIEFSTLFALNFIKEVIQSKTDNLIEKCRKQINIWFCRHLIHFPHVRQVEVLGFFFLDFTARQLARYCPQLRQFQILDINTRSLSGKNFHLFRHLEVLELPLCTSLEPKYMLKICKKLKLKELYIVENRRLMYAPILKQMFALQFSSLTILWISALADQRVVSAILELPHLEKLKFYWIDNYVSFEKVLFKELLRLRQNSLFAMGWESEPPFLMNESFVNWDPYEYELRREEVSINGCAWKCFADYPEWINLLTGCTKLETMSFLYSRILTKEQILALPRMCKTLENVQIVGSRQEFDDDVLKEWKEQTRPSCQLCIEGINWCEVKALENKEHAERDRLYRSIQCNFK